MDIEQDLVDEAADQMQEMECDDAMSEIVGDAEDLEMSEKRDNVGEMPVCFYLKLRTDCFAVRVVGQNTRSKEERAEYVCERLGRRRTRHFAWRSGRPKRAVFAGCRKRRHQHNEADVRARSATSNG